LQRQHQSSFIAYGSILPVRGSALSDDEWLSGVVNVHAFGSFSRATVKRVSKTFTRTTAYSLSKV
jgi:hypothetical protein